jgi:Effector-associated domain 1
MEDDFYLKMRDVFLAAFPQRVRLDNFVLTRLGLNAETIVAPTLDLETAWLRIIQHCLARGWVGKLLKGLDDERGGNPLVQQFLSNFALRVALAPIPHEEQFLLWGKMPMINRTALRKTLKDFTDHPSPGVMVINGPECSGKSHSFYYLNYLRQQRSPNTHVIYLNLAKDPFDPTDLEAQTTELARQITQRLPFIESQDAPARDKTNARWKTDFFNFLQKSLKANAATCWLVVDGLNQSHVTQETTDFLSALAERSTTDLQGLLVVLIGLEPDSLKVDIATEAFLQLERVQPVSQEDLVVFLDKLFQLIESDPGKRAELVSDAIINLEQQVDSIAPRYMDRLIRALIALVHQVVANIGA